MPTVVLSDGKTKKFPYTREGIRRARQYAKNTGGKYVSDKGKASAKKEPQRHLKDGKWTGKPTHTKAEYQQRQAEHSKDTVKRGVKSKAEADKLAKSGYKKIEELDTQGYFKPPKPSKMAKSRVRIKNK